MGEVTDRGAHLRGYARNSDTRINWLLFDKGLRFRPDVADHGMYVIEKLEDWLCMKLAGVV